MARKLAETARKIVKQCRIDSPKHFKLDDHDPTETFGLSTDIAEVRPIAWLVVSAAIIEALDKLKLEYPKVTGKALKEMKECERALKAEDKS